MASLSISSDLPKATALLSELSTSASSVSRTVQLLSERIAKGELHTEHGLGLLELKNQAFLSYLGNLSYTALLKLSGLPLENNYCIESIVELRVLLERLRPLENRVKYQIDKYIKLSNSTEKSATEADEPMNIKSSINDIEDSGSDNENEDKEDKRNDKDDDKIYKVPKISQTYYPGEEKKEDSKLKREKSRALNSAMLRDALYEHTDDPEVIHNMDTFKQKAVEKRREIERYEEDNFTRLTLSKKDKASLKQMSTHGTIGSEILSFRSVDAIDGRVTLSKKGKKRKNSKGKKSKGFKKRKKN